MSQLRVDADLLAEELAWIMKARLGTAATAVLRSVQVTAVVGAIQLRRTDIGTFHQSVLTGEGAGQASVLVDPTKLLTLLRSIPGEAVIEVTEAGLSIAADGRTIKLRNNGPVDEYPQWPVFERDEPEPAFASPQQVAAALVSAGVDETLPMLTGVLFDDGAMVSTDRYRLTRINYAESGFTALVPGAVLRLFASGDGLVRVEHGTIGTDKESVRVTNGRRSITSPVLNVEFPKWRQLIPSGDAPVSLMVRRADLLEAISGGGSQVTLTVPQPSPKSMTVSSTDAGGDMEVEQEIEAQVLRSDGLPFSIRFNPVILAGCLKGFSSGAVQFEAFESAKPVVLTTPGGDELHLLMPLRA